MIATAPALEHGSSQHAATFLFTDIVASTEHLAALGQDAWLDALREHNEVVTHTADCFGGQSMKFLGDGWMMTFASPRDAVDSAVVIQRVLADTRRRQGFRVRIGMHHGRAVYEGHDYVGKDVVVASRITHQAGPEEILASSDVVDALGPVDAHADRFDGGRIANLKGLGPHLVFGVRWGVSPA